MTRLQEAQRRDYRQRLLKAARYVFSRSTYAQVSVEDIALKADVSRTTFYRHFKNRLEIVAALTEEFVAVLQGAHEVFFEGGRISEKTVGAWIDRNIAAYRRHVHLVRTIREAAAIEPVFFRKHAIANHRISIQKLGEVSPAFQRAADATSDTDRCLTHAEFILRELDMLCHDVVVTGWEDGLAIGRGLVVAHFMEFHALYAD